MTSRSTVPARESFSISRRGYSPGEVDEAFDRLRRDLRAMDADRSDATQQVSELTAALDAAQGDLATARADADAAQQALDRQTSEPLTMSALSARMQRLLKIAEDEAAEVRAASDRYRADTLAQADADAADIREAAMADAERLRSDAAADVAAARAELEAELARTRNDIADERAELDQTRSTVYEQAKRLMAEARADAEALVAEARERAEHLSRAAAADREKQEEDYELAIQARRRQAHRAIVEAEQASQADASHRIDQANTHARAVVESANAHAEDLLRRAASQSHQRVAEADDAVRKLIAIRSELQQQILDLTGRLDELSDSMAAVRRTLEPLPIEAQRPSAELFPAEPDGTTSTVALAAPLPTWHPPAPPVSLAWERVSAQLESGGAPETPAGAAVDARVRDNPEAADNPEAVDNPEAADNHTADAGPTDVAAGDETATETEETVADAAS